MPPIGSDPIEAQRQTFLDAIIAEPEDDALRLIYADWLTDHGEPERAELIRVQIELEHTPEWITVGDNDGMLGGKRMICQIRNERYEYLTERMRALAIRGLGLAFCNLPPVASGKIVQCVYREGNVDNFTIWKRGFIRSMRTSWEFWTARADKICQHHPIEEVELLTMPKMNRLDFPSLKDQWTLEGRRHKPYWVDGEKTSHDLAYSLLTINWPRIKFTLPENPEAVHTMSRRPISEADRQLARLERLELQRETHDRSIHGR